MKQILKLLSCITLLSIAGCDSKPPSRYSVIWQKPDADSTEVAKALLECGKPTPYNADPENSRLGFGEWAIIHTCMLQSGFHYRSENGKWCEDCQDDRIPVYPLSGAFIPQRSVERRLNSPYCKKYKNALECQP
ncbi:hypothetical protein ME7_01434 [Bartonella birtlesii LL-WM9]|uniref:Lipoprotein n=1 Tax=Bartonella birtlesii LL-WM9 TaxID=1094552 RepID=J0PPM3_9HYPH|nr:hypothetical protein [Bartonella birtlesii]EJF74396.1 hypothetical protein ME7_01441 [Bartonella birtlesii LL-WM9]EJF74421.1 hypothetical protein ME7_01434 [Bartonella birtlesii LL-WM9]